MRTTFFYIEFTLFIFNIPISIFESKYFDSKIEQLGKCRQSKRGRQEAMGRRELSVGPTEDH